MQACIISVTTIVKMSSISVAQPQIFQSRRGFVELKHFDKLFVKKTRKKKGAGGKNFGAFSPRYS